MFKSVVKKDTNGKQDSWKWPADSLLIGAAGKLILLLKVLSHIVFARGCVETFYESNN